MADPTYLRGVEVDEAELDGWAPDPAASERAAAARAARQEPTWRPGGIALPPPADRDSEPGIDWRKQTYMDRLDACQRAIGEVGTVLAIRSARVTIRSAASGPVLLAAETMLKRVEPMLYLECESMADASPLRNPR